jgi:rod shape determining protein RodA
MIRKAIADYPLAMIALLLTAFGIATVYSAGQTDVPNAAVQAAWGRQLLWLAVGLVAFMVTTRLSVRFLEWAALPAYLLALLLLVLTLLFGSGAGTAKSMSGWLTIGGHRLGQPSELAKIAVAMMLAKVLASYRVAPRSLVDLIKPGIVVLIPWLLVMKQPDLGHWPRVRRPVLRDALLGGRVGNSAAPGREPGDQPRAGRKHRRVGRMFILLLVVLWYYKPFRRRRRRADRREPHHGRRCSTDLEQPQGASTRSPASCSSIRCATPRRRATRSCSHAIAIGSGGWTGKGFTHGSQKRLAFLPEQHTDFIFAVVGEELGFLGVAAALILFLFLFLRVIRVATRASDSFSSLVAFGIAGSWFVHVIINVGMTINLMPITGIPLPFFSYGGSFLLACWIAVGMLVRISAEGRGGPEELGLA